jgi:hypothetical protein
LLLSGVHRASRSLVNLTASGLRYVCCLTLCLSV